MDVEIVGPPEIVAAFNEGRTCSGGVRAYCSVCDPDRRKRDGGTLWAGLVRGRPWWGCHRCHCEKDYAAARKTARLRLDVNQEKAVASASRAFERAREIWELQSSEIKPGDPVDVQLRRRGLRPLGETWSTELRRARLWHSQTKRTYDGMVAAVRRPDGSFMAIHRLFLMPDGRRADDPSLPDDVRVVNAKMALGAVMGGAIRLGIDPNADTIGVAEGIESGLGFAMRVKVPCWSTISAEGMKGLRVPKDIRRVIIGPDIGDPGGPNGHGMHAGMNAAIALRTRLLAEAKRDGRPLSVEIMSPPLEDRGDWADWAKTLSR